MVLEEAEWGWDAVPLHRCRMVVGDLTWVVEVDTVMPHLGLHEVVAMAAVEIEETAVDTTTVDGNATGQEAAALKGVTPHDLDISGIRSCHNRKFCQELVNSPSSVLILHISTALLGL